MELQSDKTPQLADDLLFSRKLRPHIALVPQQAIINFHDKVSTPSRDEIDLGIRVCGLDLGGQTGRLGLVVSNHTVFDGDVHT